MIFSWGSANCTLIEDTKINLNSREDQKDQVYYLDSLIKKSPKNSEEYFVGHLLKSELLRKKKQNVDALNSLKNIAENPSSAPYANTLGTAYISMSDIYLDEKSYELAQKYITEAFIIFDALEDQDSKALTLIKSAKISKNQKKYSSATKSLLQALEIYEEQDRFYESIALSNEIGSVTYESGELGLAEQYLLKAAKGYESLNEEEELVQVHELLSSICQKRERYEDQAFYLKKIIELSFLNHKPSKTAGYVQELSLAYSKLDLKRKALEAQKQAVQLLKEDVSRAHYYALIRLSELYRISGIETDAMLKLHEANSLAMQLNNDEILLESTKIIADFYTEIKDWEKSSYYLQISDSLTRQIYETKLNKVLTAANLSNEETKAVSQLSVNSESGSFLTNWKFYLIAFCLVFLALIILVVSNIIKSKKLTRTLEWKVYKRTKKLRELNSELNTYIYKSSHDLRNPLTSIKSLITLLKGENINENGDKYLALIEDCVNQIDEILLNLSRAVDYKKFKVSPQQIDFNTLIDEINTSELGIESGLDLSWNIREKAPFFSDPNLIKVILKKTILNSNQYRLGSSSDYCKVSITTDSSGAFLTVEDNGQGISDKVKDSVFDMFVKGTHKSKGAGLGLYLVKIASDKLKGNITLESKENVGSKLVFKLPNLS